uniref:Uncharacterized protein n=1 Tax=uncultured bacterium fosmid pJB190D12_contig II TaxID=1478060 RepID=A0A0H3UA78_9BACT|nr:hypothetical protein [uncultured bacterium fosmid pJB190D12_contig II]
MPGDHRAERLRRAPRSSECTVFVQQDLPAFEQACELTCSEQAVTLRREHVHERRVLRQHVDRRYPAGPHDRLQVVDLAVGGRAVEEHQQANRDDRAEAMLFAVAAQIRSSGPQRQAFVACDALHVLDGRDAPIQRERRVPASGSLYRQVAESASEVEHAAAQVGQHRGLEWIEREVASRHLPPELVLEEGDTRAAGHVRSFGCRWARGNDVRDQPRLVRRVRYDARAGACSSTASTGRRRDRGISGPLPKRMTRSGRRPGMPIDSANCGRNAATSTG